MKEVLAEFKPRTQPGRVWWWGLCALGIGVLMAAVWAWQTHLQLLDARSRLQQAEALEEAAASAPIPVFGPPVYLQSAQAMLAERSLAWVDMLNALESSGVVGVTPTAVDIAGVGLASRVDVVFTDYAALLEYVNALGAGQTGGVVDLQWRLLQARRVGDGGGAASIAVVLPAASVVQR